MKFNQLHLSPSTLSTLNSLGFEEPTEIQAAAIPILLDAQNDFLGLAQTGTGKTLAFGLPLVERVDPDYPHTQALILAPTRELGQQIAQQIELFTKNTPINTLAVYGGANINNQLKALKKPQHIIIATPGRLIDLIRRKAVDLRYVEFVVLDEADEMLNMGFKEDIDKILSYANEDSLTWLFSATLSDDIRKIVKQYMFAPVEVQIAKKNETNKNITHFVASLHPSNKVEAIRRIVDTEDDIRAVVFCRTRRETQEVADALSALGYKADSLHGDLSQQQRDRVMGKFRKHKLQILVATDIAARGIDVEDITHVIHHNLPDEVESYTHRSGRTARAGKEGNSIALVSNRDYHRLQDIRKVLKIDFKDFQIPTSDSILDAKISKWSSDIIDNDATYNREVDEIYNSIKSQFKDMTKDEILKNLLQIELANFKQDKVKDLNEKLEKPSKNGKSRKGGKGSRGGRNGKKFSSRKSEKSFSRNSSKSRKNSRTGKRGK